MPKTLKKLVMLAKTQDLQAGSFCAGYLCLYAAVAAQRYPRAIPTRAEAFVQLRLPQGALQRRHGLEPEVA